jgi:TRAP-type mannitol/chloroaromatic compound transport system substrate-binding protein
MNINLAVALILLMPLLLLGYIKLRPERKTVSSTIRFFSEKWQLSALVYIVVVLLGIIVWKAVSPFSLGTVFSQPAAASLAANGKIGWTLVTVWPSNLPILGRNPSDLEQIAVFDHFKQNIAKRTDNNFTIDIKFIDEIPATNPWELFRKVQKNQYQMMHSAAYYYMDNIPAAFLFSAVPFGMNQFELQNWIDPDNKSGGYQYWVKLYEPYGVVPFEAGHSGQQMGGWFKRRVRTPGDFNNLTMRIGGLGGNVVAKLGATSRRMGGNEMQRLLMNNPPTLGEQVDAAEWIGAYHDEILGFSRLTRWYYYEPGWQEPDTMFEMTINKKELEKLPKQYAEVLQSEIKNLSGKITNQFNSMNNRYDKILRVERRVRYQTFSPAILCELRKSTKDAIKEKLEGNAIGVEIYENYKANITNQDKYIPEKRCNEIRAQQQTSRR